MHDLNYLNRQKAASLDECLGQLSHMLKTLGVEELTIDEHSQYHIVDRERAIDPTFLNTFCTQVAQLYGELVETHVYADLARA